MNRRISTVILTLAAGLVHTSAFPNGSYLKSLSNAQPPLDPEPSVAGLPSPSESTWNDNNPSALASAGGGPVLASDSGQSLLDSQDRFQEASGQTSSATIGFGQPPFASLSGGVSSIQTGEKVDPYVAAYAAFQKNSIPKESSNTSPANVSVEDSQTEVNENQNPSVKWKLGGGTSYLENLSSSTASTVPAAKTPSSASYVYQGHSIGGQEPYMSMWQTYSDQRSKDGSDTTKQASQDTQESVLTSDDTKSFIVDPVEDANPLTVAEEAFVTPQEVNPFATGNILYTTYLDTLSVPTPLEESQTTTDQPKKPFASGSYLENLALISSSPNQSSVSATQTEIPKSQEYVEKSSSDVADKSPTEEKSLSSYSSMRPLIPIHAVKVADIASPVTQDPDERPFFASFLPKAPVRPRGRPPVPKDLTKSRLERIMSRTSDAQATGAGGSSTYAAFKRAEENWAKLKASKPFTFDSSLTNGFLDMASSINFVSDDISSGSPRAWTKLRLAKGKKLDFDAVICGGTLGIFFATALALKGHKVCVLEAGDLRGREQEWNISMEELKELVRVGVLTDGDIEASVTTEFPGCRAGFKNEEISNLKGGYQENGIGYECFTPGVLNLGVSPAILLDRVQKRFLSLGGQMKEKTPLEGVVVSETIGAALDLGQKQQPITSRIVIDCMGNASPISKQQRLGKKPDGVCAVVGSCAGGFAPETNTVGDIIYTNSEIKDCGRNGKLQYFWEAFPVGIGRNGKEPGTSDVKTTYMFTYFDAEEYRPSLETLMEDYLDMLPTYQKSIVNAEDDLDFKRVLFAFFPTYQDSPLKPQWSRVLAVGDASGIQSPLSFGGFGSLTRHLDRITTAISEALDDDLLSQDDLAEINAYQPNLSAAWMFQKAMSIRLGQDTDSKFINRLLATNFEVMNEQGPRVIKPFLQDVVRFDGLASSLSGSFVKDPTFMPDIIRHVGITTLAQWICHVAMMGLYAFLHAVVTPVLSPFVRLFKNARQRFQWRRRMESWKYGSGSDFVFIPEKDAP